MNINSTKKIVTETNKANKKTDKIHGEASRSDI